MKAVFHWLEVERVGVKARGRPWLCLGKGLLRACARRAAESTGQLKHMSDDGRPCIRPSVLSGLFLSSLSQARLAPQPKGAWG